MAQVTSEIATVDAEGQDTRDVNRAIKQAIADGAREIHVQHPAGRHSFAVALKAGRRHDRVRGAGRAGTPPA